MHDHLYTLNPKPIIACSDVITIGDIKYFSCGIYTIVVNFYITYKMHSTHISKPKEAKELLEVNLIYGNGFNQTKLNFMILLKNNNGRGKCT